MNGTLRSLAVLVAASVHSCRGAPRDRPRHHHRPIAVGSGDWQDRGRAPATGTAHEGLSRPPARRHRAPAWPRDRAPWGPHGHWRLPVRQRAATVAAGRPRGRRRRRLPWRTIDPRSRARHASPLRDERDVRRDALAGPGREVVAGGAFPCPPSTPSRARHASPLRLFPRRPRPGWAVRARHASLPHPPAGEVAGADSPPSRWRYSVAPR